MLINIFKYCLTNPGTCAILISVTGIVTDIHQKEIEHQNIILKRKGEQDYEDMGMYSMWLCMGRRDSTGEMSPVWSSGIQVQRAG